MAAHTALPGTTGTYPAGVVIERRVRPGGDRDRRLTAELDEHHRRIFAIYFAAWAQGDGATMARIMAEFSPSARVPDYAAYEADIERFVARFHGKPLGEVAVGQVVFDRAESQCNYDIRATYDDNDTTDMRNVNLCQVGTVNLVDQ